MDRATGIEKNYREKRVQLNRPVQCGGNSNITEKTVISCPCVNTAEGCSMLEKGGPRNALPMCARKEDREREDPEPTWISNGNTNQIGAR